MPSQHAYSFEVADWRRQVHSLYRDVRAARSPAEGYAIWVTGRTELFASHPASPRSGNQRLVHADYDPAFRFMLPVSTVDVDDEADRFEVATGTDGVVPFERIGRFELPAIDSFEPAGLDIWWLASYGGGIFLPLRDGTAGSLTYGAGRYLLDTVKGADLGRADADPRGAGLAGAGLAGAGDLTGAAWIVDLNFAYNPSCVYDSRWACPLAPAGNRISAPIPVGELLPKAG
jgi:uncharacterized protein (DUF1684 family)